VTFVPDNEHFKNFAGTLERHIARYGTPEDWFAYQKRQVEALIALEKKWRAAVIRHRFGPWMYRKFISFISEEKRNILAARPYFRERQEVFARSISKALKKGPAGVDDLYRFSINYQFVLFVMRARVWGATSQVTQLADKIGKLRKAIVVMNMPLAINRARVFYSRTPHAHLSYMDLIQIASEGWMSGVDKYTPARGGVITKQFRSTAMGRMGGNFIEEYSETLVHFYPIDKRKLYRAHKLVGKYATGVDHEQLASDVNKAVKKKDKKKKDEGPIGTPFRDDSEVVKEDEAHPTNAAEIHDLMAAASTVSADSSLPTDPDAPEPITRFAAPESCRPDVRVENHHAFLLMAEAETKLTVFERKLLRLKGVRLDHIQEGEV